VATPSLARARSHYERQRQIGLAALAAVRALFKANKRPEVVQIAATAARYQLAAAAYSTRAVAGFAGSTQPVTIVTPFAGVSSQGFPLTEPIIATIDAKVPAPAEPLPAAWWSDAEEFMSNLEQLILTEVADAGRSASQVEFVARPTWQNYVRLLNPPSCMRCALLAGRVYRDLDAFQRHPGCDCVMVPVQDWQSAYDAGLISSFEQAFKRGDVMGLSKADSRAITDGADPGQVINASRGLGAPGVTAAVRTEVFGRKVKATTDGTTKRAAWRKANPTRLVRLRPESIYHFASNREDAIRMLRLYGYLR
jgi:hypothetical protein